MVSRFFKQVARHFANDMAVVSPNGELLHHSPSEGLAQWKAMPEADRKKVVDYGEYDASLDPQPPAKGGVFKVWARAFQRNDAGALEIYKTKTSRSWEAGRDHFWLTEAELASLVPSGDSSEMPAPVADRLIRTCLVDLVRVGGNGGARRPEQVLRKEIRLSVSERTPARLRLAVSGSTRIATHDPGSGAKGKEPKVDDFRFSGEAVYDPAAARFERFTFVAYSETGHYDEVAEKILPFAVGFELIAAEAPMDRIPPAHYSANYFK
jgi:hypothetical protein